MTEEELIKRIKKLANEIRNPESYLPEEYLDQCREDLELLEKLYRALYF